MTTFTEFLMTTKQKGDNMLMATKQVTDLTAAQKKVFYANVNAAAEAAGQAAGEVAVVDQYVAVQRANCFDDSSEIVKVWEDSFEAVGHACIQVKGANKGFGRWVVVSGIGETDSYNGGAAIYVSQFDQSHARKVKYARAYASTATALLAEAGEDADIWVWERLN